MVVLSLTVVDALCPVALIELLLQETALHSLHPIIANLLVAGSVDGYKMEKVLV